MQPSPAPHYRMSRSGVVNRRFFTFGAAALLVAPSIVRVSSLMPMSATHRVVELAHYNLRARGGIDSTDSWDMTMSGEFRSMAEAEARFAQSFPSRPYYTAGDVIVPHRKVWVPA